MSYQSEEPATTPLVMSNDGEYHETVVHMAAPSWTRRVLAIAAASAVFGAAAIYSSEQGLFSATAALSADEDGAPSTYSFGNVSLTVGAEASSAYESEGMQSTVVSVEAFGISSSVLEYANSVVTELTAAHLDSLAISTSMTKYLDKTETELMAEDTLTIEETTPMTVRRLRTADEVVGDKEPGNLKYDKPMSGPGGLTTRKQSTEAGCQATTSDDDLLHYVYTCSLPHSSDAEFMSGVKSVYKGIFQSYKEVVGQIVGSSDSSSELVLGTYSLEAMGSSETTDISFKVHPLSTDTAKSYWWVQATGDEAEEAVTSISTFVSSIATMATAATTAMEYAEYLEAGKMPNSLLLKMAAEDSEPCAITSSGGSTMSKTMKALKSSSTMYTLKCTVDLQATVGMVGGLTTAVEAMAHMV